MPRPRRRPGSDRDPNPDREFGVPFPGELLPPEKWAKTALKAMPDPGPLDWAALFGRRAPVVLDLGCGNGRSTIVSALTRPTHDHLGIDTLPVVIRYARKRGNNRGCHNARFAVLGGHELLANYVPPASVAEIHVYHPQPYYEASQVYRRLVTPEFLHLAHRSLIDGGTLTIQTDNPGYWRYIQEVVPAFFDLAERVGRWPDAPKGRTRREILALKRGLPVFRGVGTRRADVTPEQALRAAENLPPPVFDADRKLRALDGLA